MKSLNIKNLSITIRSIVFILLVTTLIACASRLVNHSFSFDALEDSPEIVILNYSYGNSKQPSARATEFELKQNRVNQSARINGEMLVGDSLFVKWRIKNTGKVYEDLVDLKKLLPRNIENHRVYFIVKERQLFVYLITPNRRLPTEESNGPRVYSALKTITISSNFGREVTTK